MVGLVGELVINVSPCCLENERMVLVVFTALLSRKKWVVSGMCLGDGKMGEEN